MHIHVFHGMPGCLPDGDVTCVDTTADALTAWRADIRPVLDNVDDDATFLAIDTRLHVITESDVETDSLSMELPDGYLYTMEHVPGDRAACELSEVDA